MNLIPKPKKVTVRGALGAMVAKTLIIFGLTMTGFFYMVANAGSAPVITDAWDGNYGRPHAVGSPDYLVEKHDCWKGASPKDMEGQIPGHVILRMEGEVAAEYRGADYVSVALDHLFGKSNPNVADVVAFCR